MSSGRACVANGLAWLFGTRLEQQLSYVCCYEGGRRLHAVWQYMGCHTSCMRLHAACICSLTGRSFKCVIS